MPFPKFKDKHLEEPLFTARDFKAYKRGGSNYVPEKMVICYWRYSLAYFKRKYKGKYKKFSLTLNPRNPTNRKETTNQKQKIRTFSRLGLGKQPAFLRYGGSREQAP